MGRAKLRSKATARIHAMPKDLIARAVREAVTQTATAMGVIDGLCAFHAAVGQQVLHQNFGLDPSIVAGDIRRHITAQVFHTYAFGGERIDASIGACHVWLMDGSTKALIDFSAWEEPVRYDASGCPHGPWTAARPDYYWASPGDPAPGIRQVLPDRDATSYVLNRLQNDAEKKFVATAVVKATAIVGSCDAEEIGLQEMRAGAYDPTK